MPTMTELEFFRQIQKSDNLKTIPFLMLTAERKPDKRMAARKSGITHYLIKPVGEEAFRKTVKNLLQL